MSEVILAIILVCLVLIIAYPRKERLVNRPSEQDKIRYADTIVKHKELFARSAGYDHARQRMEWLDPITYEDARTLSRNNKLNQSEVVKLLS